MKGFLNLMKSIPALFTQQAESNQHTQTKSLAVMQANSTKGESQMNPDTTGNSTTQPSKEDQVNQIINEGLAVASPFIPGGPVAAKVAAITGLTPAVVHLGFMFAHLFSHPAVMAATVAAQQQVATPDPAVVAAQQAEAAKQQRIADLKAELEKLQSA